MKINFLTKSIELFQTELKRASQYGSPEYHELQAILKDLPDYQIEVIRRVTPRSYCSLTYEAMEAYVAGSELAEEFRMLRDHGVPYAQIKQWFLSRTQETMHPAA